MPSKLPAGATVVSGTFQYPSSTACAGDLQGKPCLGVIHQLMQAPSIQLKWAAALKFRYPKLPQRCASGQVFSVNICARARSCSTAALGAPTGQC